MDAKFQEYLDQISSEKYGDDVRSAIQHALVYLYDKFSRQNRTFDSADAYANTLLDDLWGDAIDFAEALGVHDVERKNLIDDPDAEGGLNDLESYTHDLVEFLRLFHAVVKYNPSLSEDSRVNELVQAMNQALRTYTVVEEVKLACSFSVGNTGIIDPYLSGNISVIPIGNCLNLAIKLLYFNHFPGITVRGSGGSSDTTYPGINNVPIICLSSGLPSENVTSAMKYLADVKGTNDPSSLPSVTDFGDMVVDSVYKVDGNTGLIYPIDNKENYVLVDGSLNVSQLNNAKYLILGQVCMSPRNAYDTYYYNKARKITEGITGSIFARIEMTRATFLNRNI